MKKIFIFLVVGIFLVSALATKTSAQDFDYNRAYQDYTYNYDLYKKAHSEYDLKRAQYLQSRTLISQEEAQKATAKMLQARDQATITYLTAIRLKLAETKGVDAIQRETYYSLIDADVAWYKTHRDSISSAASLEDLVKDSDAAAERYKSTEITIYKSLLLVSNGKTDNFQTLISDLTGKIETKVSQIRANGDKDTSDIERWILEVKNRVSRSQDKETEGWALINKLKLTDKTKITTYNAAEGKFSESLQYLKEANSFLKQIITEIKTQD
ncbi:MAG: hypothetical protein AAB546_00210 [Patescibacteria group bacterium]